MRVCILGSRGFPVVYSGYETLVTHLAPALASRGMEVTVYCHSHLFDERPAEVDGVKLTYVPGVKGKWLSQYSHSASATMSTLKAKHDVALILNVANGVVLPFMAAAGIPTIVNVDGMEWDRPKWKGLGSVAFKIAARLTARFATSIVTDADAMRDRYIEKFDRDSVVIPYGADIEAGDETVDTEVLAGFGITDGDYLLILGRLIPDNNGELLVKAYLEGGMETPLVVIGDVPYRDEYAARLKALGGSRVIFTGYINDQFVLRTLIARARLYLHGHEFGGTNPSLLLAMSTGVPIAALDTVFSREVLPETEGVSFFSKDVADATAVLSAAAVRPRTGRIEALLERVLQRYQWPEVVDAYAELINQVATKSDR